MQVKKVYQDKGINNFSISTYHLGEQKIWKPLEPSNCFKISDIFYLHLEKWSPTSTFSVVPWER